MQRCNTLQSCQNFRIRVHAEYPGYGGLEHQVHEALKTLQVQDVSGTEWFLCTPAEAMEAITTVIASESQEPQLTTDPYLQPPLTMEEMVQALGSVFDDEESVLDDEESEECFSPMSHGW